MRKGILVFLGFNSMHTHKRGVENVIHFQSQASPFTSNYYLHWDNQTRVGRYDDLITIGIKKDFFWFITLNLLLTKLKKRNNKIFIHSHNPLMSIICRYQSQLFTVHDGLYYLSSVTRHKWTNVFWMLEKILYLRCKYVHFISDYSKKMSLYQGEKNYEIIPNTSHFEMMTRQDVFFTIDLKKIDTTTLKVFIVRSIEERALINLIIEVAEKLKEETIEFLIAGKGPLLETCRARIKALNLKNITLLGYVSDNDLINYYKNCDLVLVPAAYGEGFGLPIIEGYLFDKPVIASNVCAIPEVIFSKEYLFENTVENIISKINFAKSQNNVQFRKYYDGQFSNKVILLKMNELYMK